MKNIFFLLVLLSNFATAERFGGYFFSAFDGDSMIVLTEGGRRIQIELVLVDAPELAQPYGEGSRENLLSLCIGKLVEVDVEKWYDSHTVLAKRAWCNKKDINREMVQKGMAWINILHHESVYLLVYERDARYKSLAIWSDPSAVPPWVFRDRYSE